MHVLLTGATGFLGSHLLRFLLEANHAVSILKRSTSSIERISAIVDNCKTYDVDKVSLESVFSIDKLDCIIHAACNYGRAGEPISLMVDTNVLYPLRLIELARVNNVSTFINVDTMLPKSVSPYSLTKAQLIEWLEVFVDENFKIINMKIEHMYGPEDDSKKFLTWLVSQLRMNVKTIGVTKGEQKRDFIHVDDVSSAFLAVLGSLDTMKGYSEFQVGTGRSIPLRDTIDMLVSLFKEHYPENHTKIEYGKISYREKEPMEIVVNPSRLAKLGWNPVYDIKEGLQDLLFGMEVER